MANEKTDAGWVVAFFAVAAAAGLFLLLGKPDVPTRQRAGESAAEEPAEGAPRKIKDPAVAGLFYPSDARTLAGDIERYLAAAQPGKPEGKLRGVVAPHAGYQYSGPVAAYAYKLLKGSDIRTVIVMAPSHYAEFQGVALPDEDAFRTPLGVTRVSSKVAALAGKGPFAINPRATVYRPGWAAESPLRVSGAGNPFTWEHSVEVEIPFLQSVLRDFRLVPMVFGQQVNEAEAAKVLAGILDDQTLIVASSDLSHYHPYGKAQELDSACVKAICDLNVEALGGQEACGKSPILTLVHIARAKGWKAQLLDCRNSGDTAGDRSRVVGYAAIAFYEPGAARGPEAKSGAYSPEDRQFLLKLARQTIEARVKGQPAPNVDAGTLDAKFRERRGCFVTLTQNGRLRGCIGDIFPERPLHQAVIQRAISAAFNDPRFQPVAANEVDKLEIEISVLTVPQPLAFSSPEDLVKKLRPHVDGVLLQIGAAGATYLPQVWEHFADPAEFLSELSVKAGCSRNAWRGRDVRVLTYQAEAFHEDAKEKGEGRKEKGQ
jgi:hypothetical protein